MSSKSKWIIMWKFIDRLRHLWHYRILFRCLEDLYWQCIEEKFCYDESIGESNWYCFMSVEENLLITKSLALGDDIVKWWYMTDSGVKLSSNCWGFFLRIYRKMLTILEFLRKNYAKLWWTNVVYLSWWWFIRLRLNQSDDF